MKKISCLLFWLSCQQVEAQLNDSLIQHRDSSLTELTGTMPDNIPIVYMDDETPDAGLNNDMPTLLSASRSPFYNAAIFSFFHVRYRIRGYANNYNQFFINNLPFNNLENGQPQYHLSGGLNDVFRNRDISLQLQPNTFTFGGIGNYTTTDIRAGTQRRQTSVSYAYSNRNYNHRLMVYHGTGFNKKGWAFAFAASRRYAKEGYIPGTYYDGYSYFLAADKKLDFRQTLSLTVFAAPTESGGAAASVKEAMELAGTHYYNPFWGWQNGQKRNARIRKSHIPSALLVYQNRLNDKTDFSIAAGITSGESSYSGLDWYKAPDPRPDYYRYLPSWYENTDVNQAKDLLELYRQNPGLLQINWQQLYDINRNSIASDSLSGRANYILGEKVTYTNQLKSNILLHSRLARHIQITAGLTFQLQDDHYYQRIADLLGSRFWINTNPFAERDYPSDNQTIQNDLDHPNQPKYKGDTYGYDYTLFLMKITEWVQAIFNYRHFDFSLATEISYQEMQRNGHTRNGLFPDQSYGKSAPLRFANGNIKTGVTYKINGRHYITLHAASLSQPPFANTVFTSPRTRNHTAPDAANESIRSAESSYIWNMPSLKLHLSGYYTTFKNGMELRSFYDDAYRSFVNYTIRNIDKIHYGWEAGTEFNIHPQLSIDAAAAGGHYYYSNRPEALVTADNSATVLTQQTIYWKNYRIAGTPQKVYHAGITYRSSNFWFLKLSGNYTSDSWISINPMRRTEATTEDIDAATYPELWKRILQQEKLPPNFTLDIFGSLSLKVAYHKRKPVYLVCNLGMNNLLNKKTIISGAYEQLRFDVKGKDMDMFPPKYYYAQGLNCFINSAIRF